MKMSSPVQKSSYRRLKVLPESTATNKYGDKLGLQPTPPPGKRPSSSSSKSSSRPGTANSMASVDSSVDTSIHSTLKSKQSTLLAPLNVDKDTSKGATTIGRYHTIVPPIKQQCALNLDALRPISRSYSIMAETPINLKTSEEFTNDDRAIESVSEENTPSGQFRSENPLINSEHMISSPTARAEYGEPENPNISFNTEGHLVPTLPKEPVEGEPRLKLAVKLGDGSRIERFFNLDDQLQTIIDFASIKVNSSLEGYYLRSQDGTYKELGASIQHSKVRDRTLFHIEPPDG